MSLHPDSDRNRMHEALARAGFLPISGREGQRDGRSSEDTARDAMMREVDRELAEITRVIGLRRIAGASDPHLDALEQKAGDLQALRERITSASSPVQLAQLRHQVAETVRASESAVTASGSTSAVLQSANRYIAAQQYEQRAAEAQQFLAQSAQRLESNSREMSQWGKTFGVDLAEQDQKERDLKRKEDELRQKGDVIGALDVRDDRLENNIDGYKKLVDSGKLDKATEEKAREKWKATREEQYETVRKKDELERTKGQQNEATQERLNTIEKNIRDEFGDKEADRVVAAHQRRTDLTAAWSDERSPIKALQQDELHHNATKERDTGKLNLSADVSGMAELTMTPFEMNKPDQAAMKEQAKNAAQPAREAGTKDTSATADLSADAKQASVQKVADNGKPPSITI